jgi:hypothetical protein
LLHVLLFPGIGADVRVAEAGCMVSACPRNPPQCFSGDGLAADDEDGDGVASAPIPYERIEGGKVRQVGVGGNRVDME